MARHTNCQYIYNKERAAMAPKAKPRYATFQKNALKIAHFYCKSISWEGWVASLRRRRTVRYFYYFTMLHASFSFLAFDQFGGSGIIFSLFLFSVSFSCGRILGGVEEVVLKPQKPPAHFYLILFFFPKKISKTGQPDQFYYTYIIPWFLLGLLVFFFLYLPSLAYFEGEYVIALYSDPDIVPPFV